MAPSKCSVVRGMFRLDNDGMMSGNEIKSEMCA